MTLDVESGNNWLPPSAPSPSPSPAPAGESFADFFEKHPLIVGCLAILLFPVAIAVGTIVGAKWLLGNGHHYAAIALIVVGSAAALAGGAWWIANSGNAKEERPTSVVRSQSETSGRAWLSPDGSGGNCAWFPGAASDYAGSFVFCDYSAP